MSNRGRLNGLAARLDRDGLWLAALLGTLVSLAATGFVFGLNNNLFHLPIVATSTTSRSIRTTRLSSRCATTPPGHGCCSRARLTHIDPYWLFLGLFAASRFIAVAGFLYCARLVGIEKLSQQLVFALLIATTHLLRGGSMAGDGGLFINYFTHSEIANGLFLFALAFAFRNRIIAAMALTGLTFFVNAFFGVWTAFVIGIVFLVQIWRGELPWRKVLVQGAIGAVPAVLLAAPVVLAVLANPEFGKPQAFDYAAYLNEYYPIHFLFASIGLPGKVGLVLIVSAAASAFMLLGQTGRPWIVALVCRLRALCHRHRRLLRHALGDHSQSASAAQQHTHSPARGLRAVRAGDTLVVRQRQEAGCAGRAVLLVLHRAAR